MRLQIIIPTFNASRWFDEAIASVAGYPESEVLVIDDGSNDFERDAIIQKCLPHKNVKFFARPRSGIVSTLNFGIEISTAPYIARMDADDISLPGRFDKQLAFLEAHPEISLVGGQMLGIDSDGRFNGKRTHFPTSTSDIAASLANGKNPFMHPSVMMRRDAVIAVGSYRPATEYAEDFDLWLRLAEHYLLANFAEPLIYYRRHDRQITRSTNWEQKFARDLATLSAHCRRRRNDDPLAQIHQKISLEDQYATYHTDIMNLISAYRVLATDSKGHPVSADTIKWILSGINTGLMERSSKPQAKAAAHAAKIAWRESHILLALSAVGKGIRRNPLACLSGLIS